jgi:D-alanyl-lipoteichoic acid acyltransferase DltB (MBOAT superfamily)
MFFRWLVRYIYIPLGGNKLSLPRQALNTFFVFTFVAVWHDVTWQLLAWGMPVSEHRTRLMEAEIMHPRESY